MGGGPGEAGLKGNNAEGEELGVLGLDSPGSGGLWRCAPHFQVGNKVQLPPPLGAVSTCGKVAALMKSFNQENSRAIHLSTESNISSMKMWWCVSQPSLMPAVLGAVITPQHDFRRILSMRSLPIGSYSLPVICCYFFSFLFSILSGCWGSMRAWKQMKKLCGPVCPFLFSD